MFGKRIYIFGLLVFLVTSFTGMIYLAVQQNLRQSANDPQIQLAEDTANVLNQNAHPPLDAPGKIDISASLSPFLIIYDQAGNVVNATGEVDGKTPVLPPSVFQVVSKNGESRFTWQPQIGVRIAAVITKYTGGFVLAGRSLREVEQREDQLLMNLLISWTVSIVIVFIFSWLLLPFQSKTKR